MFETVAIRLCSFVGRYLCRFRGTRLIDSLARCNDVFGRRLDNLNFDISTNGELRVLHLLNRIEPHCAFDVGAGEGEWTKRMLDLYPQCVIHAFEPVPCTFGKLVGKTRHRSSQIALNQFGLSNTTGTIPIYYTETDSSTATGCPIRGMAFHDQYYSSSMTCRMRKAADYIREHHIQQIDVLKIDVEGMEWQVIKGFEDELSRVRVIQFEYGIFNIAAHALLYDFCIFLEEQGFVTGKIFPRYVDFFKYHYHRENFLGGNYIAVRRSERELIQSLSDRRRQSNPSFGLKD